MSSEKRVVRTEPAHAAEPPQGISVYVLLMHAIYDNFTCTTKMVLCDDSVGIILFLQTQHSQHAIITSQTTIPDNSIKSLTYVRCCNTYLVWRIFQTDTFPEVWDSQPLAT